MGRWTDDDRQQFWRDMVIVFHHPDFRDMKPIDALGELKRRRREQRREEHRDQLNA